MTSDPREPIIRRLAERLGVPFETIAGDGQNSPRIEVETTLGCGWAHTLRYRWGTPGAPTSMIEIHDDGTVQHYGGPPDTWEPAITISSADLVAALDDAARDIHELLHGSSHDER